MVLEGGWEHNPGHLKEIEMIDNAAIGTAMIGLGEVKREQELYDAHVPQPPPTREARGLAIRLAVAHALRQPADGLEPGQRSAGPSRA